MTGLVQASSEETRPRSSSPWLLVWTSLVLGPELASRRAEHSHFRGSLYIFLIYCFYHLTCLCNKFYGLSVLVGCWSSAFIRRIIHTELDLHRLWLVSMEHLQRVWHASRKRLPFRTPGSVPHCGTCLCSNCWDQIPRTCNVFTRLLPRIILGTFSILLTNF